MFDVMGLEHGRQHDEHCGNFDGEQLHWNYDHHAACQPIRDGRPKQQTFSVAATSATFAAQLPVAEKKRREHRIGEFIQLHERLQRQSWTEVKNSPSS